MAKPDVWRSAIRLSNVKGVIQDMDKDIKHIVSGLSYTSSISNIMPLHKMRNNLKSCVVQQVKINIRTIYRIESVKCESKINQRIDFLLKKNQ